MTQFGVTNINRQIHSTMNTLGKLKIDVMKERILDINPDSNVTTYNIFCTPDNLSELISQDLDYIIDAIDNVTAKLHLIELSKKLNIPIISCMGMGNKLNPFKLEITDISKTSICPLAKIIRKELSNRCIKDVKVLYSKETPIKLEDSLDSTNIPKGKHQIPGSISYMPSIAGLIIAGEVIKDLCKK